MILDRIKEPFFSQTTALWLVISLVFLGVAFAIPYMSPPRVEICDEMPSCSVRRCAKQKMNLFSADECLEWQDFVGPCRANCRMVPQ